MWYIWTNLKIVKNEIVKNHGRCSYAWTSIPNGQWIFALLSFTQCHVCCWWIDDANSLSLILGMVPFLLAGTMITLIHWWVCLWVFLSFLIWLWLVCLCLSYGHNSKLIYPYFVEVKLSYLRMDKEGSRVVCTLYCEIWKWRNGVEF